jgi:hypothetical protein
VEVDLAPPADPAPFFEDRSEMATTRAKQNRSRKRNPVFVFDDAPLPVVKPAPADVGLHVHGRSQAAGSLAGRRWHTERGRPPADARGRVRDGLEGTIGRSQNRPRTATSRFVQRLRQNGTPATKGSTQGRAADECGGEPAGKVPRHGKWRRAPMGGSW